MTPDIPMPPMNAPAQPYMGQPPYMGQVPPMQMQQGGQLNQFFKSLNWTEIIITTTALTALFFVIKYYNFSMNKEKQSIRNIQEQVDSTDAKLEKMSKARKEQQKRFI